MFPVVSVAGAARFCARSVTMAKISGVESKIGLRPIFLVAVALSVLATWEFALGRDSESPSKTRMVSFMSAYTDCVINWAGEYVSARATPTEIAEAAHSKCLHKFQEFEEAQKHYLLSITPAGTSETQAIDKAKAISSDIREMTKAHIIRLVIETRSEK